MGESEKELDMHQGAKDNLWIQSNKDMENLLRDEHEKAELHALQIERELLGQIPLPPDFNSDLKEEILFELLPREAEDIFRRIRIGDALSTTIPRIFPLRHGDLRFDTLTKSDDPTDTSARRFQEAQVDFRQETFDPDVIGAVLARLPLTDKQVIQTRDAIITTKQQLFSSPGLHVRILPITGHFPAVFLTPIPLSLPK